MPNIFTGSGTQSAFKVNALFSIINDATASVKTKLQEIKNNTSSISIGDMFEMQMLMNHLSQLSEMSTSVVGASNSVLADMARNVKA